MYPADDFHMVKKYGQTVLVTQDLALENYLEKYVVDAIAGCAQRHGANPGPRPFAAGY